MKTISIVLMLLSVLLCSKLIYNSLGSIDEDAISNLSFVANLTQMIHVNSKKNKKKSVHENPNHSPTTNLYCKFPFIISKNGRLKLFQKIIGFSGGRFAEA